MAAGEQLQPEPQVPIGPLTTLGVGGAARWFLRATAVEHVAAAHRWAADGKCRLFVLGGGSNVVVSDRGFDGLVLHVALRGTARSRAGEEQVFDVAAGEPWDPFVAQTVDEGLAGLECLSGIPGSVGGTPIQNVGAYGQEVAGTIESVTAVDRLTNDVVHIGGADCGFRYRQSRFKAADAGRFTVCRVAFRLRPGEPTMTYPDVVRHLERHGVRAPTVTDVRRAVLEVRRRKAMVLDPADPDTRSVGSFFMNPVVTPSQLAECGRIAAPAGMPVPGFPLPGGATKIPAAWLIEQSGFTKGMIAGRAGISSKHPLALINRGGASADEIVGLAVEVKRAVADRFGIRLRPEPVFVGFEDDPRIAFLQESEPQHVDAAD